jgi:hypothetical protein
MPQVENSLHKPVNKITMFTGESPRTTFRNMEQSVKVELISVHDPVGAMLEMSQVPLCPTIPDSPDDKRLQAAMEGKGLWMIEEIPQFLFKITGVSRILTHQLVRQRIGVTFMQQCTGEVDHRHGDIIVPGCIVTRSWPLWMAFRDSVLKAKLVYSEMLDAGIPLQAARYVLPHGLSTVIYMQASLATVRTIYQKRSCTMTQAWEMVLFANRMQRAILDYDLKFAAMLGRPCDHNACWYQKVRQTDVQPPLWRPDAQHDTFDWSPADYMYPGTNQEQTSPAETILPQHFVGWEQVT